MLQCLSLPLSFSGLADLRVECFGLDYEPEEPQTLAGPTQNDSTVQPLAQEVPEMDCNPVSRFRCCVTVAVQTSRLTIIGQNIASSNELTVNWVCGQADQTLNPQP